MDWLNLVEFQQLKRLTMKGNCVDEYECVDAEYMKQALEREEALLAKLNTME